MRCIQITSAKTQNKMIWQPKLPVLSSSLAYFGVLHMLHSDLLAQFTFPHLRAEAKLIIFSVNFIITSCLWSNFQHLGYKVNYDYDTMFHKHIRFALPVICTKETSTFFSQSFPNLCSTCFHHLCISGFVCATEGKHGFIRHIKHLFNMYIRFLHKERRLTSTTSVTTSSSGKIHISTSIKEHHTDT